MIDEREDCYNYVPGPDRPIYERVDYVRQRTITELEIYAEDLGADSVRALPQNTFTAGLRHCCQMIFRPQTGDRKEDYFKIDIGDRALIIALAQVYIDICDRYNKVCQVQGLSAYLGIKDDYLYNMSKYDNTRYIDNIYDGNTMLYNKYNNIGDQGGEKLNILCKPDNVIKEIKAAKERQLQGLLIDGKGNLIGVMSILNHEFGYRSEGVDDVTPTLTTAERQKSLADKYRVSALPDKLSDT
jgi:hypothetical protein